MASLKLFEYKSFQLKDNIVYIAAYSQVHALMLYCKEFDLNITDLDPHDIVNEIPKGAVKALGVPFPGYPEIILEI
jgi:hypothetical protein